MGEWRTTNEIAHVTVGTRDEGVKPKESNVLLERWLRVGSGGGVGKEGDGGVREDGESAIGEVSVQGYVTVTGEVRGVAARR